MSWSTSELRVRLAPLNRFKPSSKIFYWPFQGGTSFVDLLCFCSVLCLLCFVCVCLYVLRGHLLGKGWPLGSRLWCLLWVCHFPIGILGQVWYLIVSIPDLCNLTYFDLHILLVEKVVWPVNWIGRKSSLTCEFYWWKKAVHLYIHIEPNSLASLTFTECRSPSVHILHIEILRSKLLLLHNSWHRTWSMWAERCWTHHLYTKKWEKCQTKKALH